MTVLDFLVITVIVWGIVRIICTWLRTRDGLSQKHIKTLEQRLGMLENQQVPDVRRRLGILEEIFVTEDVTLQRKLHQALGGDALATPPRPSAGRPPERP